MHTSPTPLSCALAIIREVDLSELPAIKDTVTVSLLQEIKKHPKRQATGEVVLDEVREWVDEYNLKTATEDRLLMLKRIVARQQNGMKPFTGGITESMIELAKGYPIEEMLATKVFHGSGKWIACTHCPLPNHQGERTPSFFIDKNNRWRCFGCSAQGSVIDLYMQLNGVNFIQAVKALAK